MSPIRPTRRVLGAAGLVLALAGCSLGSGSGETSSSTSASGSSSSSGSASASADENRCADGGTVTLITHDSFALPKELTADFEESSGCTLEVVTSGDAGELTNKLVLTKGSPVADVVFGIDNTFAGRATSEGVLEAYSAELPEGAAAHLPSDDSAQVTPVDFGDVCVNIDKTWFDKEGRTPPTTLDDLVRPEYEDLFVTPGAATSSPGLAFLLATISAKGEDGWQQYWEDLVDNGAKVTSGWSDAYGVDFSGGEGKGDRPIVLSYASSPPFTIPEGEDEPTTEALLDTCYRQVEYAAVLKGAKEPGGARAVVDWLISPEVQAAIPDSMYVYPVDTEVELPELWARWAKTADTPLTLDPATVEEKRDTWQREWTDITS